MGIVEEKVIELKKYKPDLTRKPDFERFWQLAIEEVFPNEEQKSWKIDTEAREISEKYEITYELALEDYSYPLEKKVKIHKACLEASDGTLLHGWYICPAEAADEKKVPGLVRFHGYSSNKGKLSELLLWALQGYAILAMDIRGQCGDTPDGRAYATGAFSGWMTLGLNSPLEYYYRQVYLDCVQITEALARRPEVDETKIGLFGNSQGGALAVIAAGIISRFQDLVPGITARVIAVNAGIPFLSDMKRAYREHSDGPWMEFEWFFRMYDPLHEREDEIFDLLSYFDAMNFAPWVKCSTLISVGLKDTACPPPTIYALYNHLASADKEIIPYADYGHESIDSHVDKHIIFFAEILLNN